MNRYALLIKFPNRIIKNIDISPLNLNIKKMMQPSALAPDCPAPECLATECPWRPSA